MFTNPKTLEEVIANAIEVKENIDKAIVGARQIEVKHEGRPERVVVRQGDTATLLDFMVGPGIYKDGNGDYISRAEAQAEVDFLNGR